ncbi:MAG: ATP-dependent helicase, partial [Cyanobacteria bacterium J06626_26]
AEIAARSLEKLQTQIKEAVTSERLASFLPIVSQLTEEYDPHTVAAAALQMAYDQTRPAWMRGDSEDQPYLAEEEPRRQRSRRARRRRIHTPAS